jgi:hypothetical protein
VSNTTRAIFALNCSIWTANIVQDLPTEPHIVRVFIVAMSFFIALAPWRDEK